MASKPDDTTGSLAEALANARRLLTRAPKVAAEQVRAILAQLPSQPEALLLLGQALAAQGDEDGAIAAFGRATAAAPGSADAWRALGDRLTLAGDTAAADAAYARMIRASVTDPELVAAAAALVEGRLAVAEPILRARLKAKPTDVAAIRMLAELGARLGRYGDSEKLLARAVELAPGFLPARHNLAIMLFRQNKVPETLAALEPLIAAEPHNPSYGNLQAAALARIGDYQGSIETYAAVLKRHPNQPKGWMSYGHALKTAGRSADSVAAYREAVRQQPAFGEAWWSLANLKTFRFEDADVATMRSMLARDDLAPDDRFHLHFALAKALEDAGDADAAFAHYADGNALRRLQLDYSADAMRDDVDRAVAFYTPDLFAERRGQGCDAADPIFIVGLPRAGSTLVEQILASHSMVEGTAELPDIAAMATRLGERRQRQQETRYPEVLATLSPDELRALGEEYLERTRIQRKTARPLFIDKMPNNWLHVGFIRLILPRATIIDARRHPLGCCFSGFKQHFARGQAFTYSLDDIGRYYADYVRLMAHFDRVLPGHVHRVIYEAMVDDTEAQVRALLGHCRLPFEAACLRFWETERAVRTASSEQVRRPIFREGVEQWSKFDAHLGPLRAALGPVLDHYPQVPPGWR